MDDHSLMQQRRDTKARWESFNPILGAGQIGYEIDLYPWKSKTGDGTKRWLELPYNASLPLGGMTGQALVKKSNADGDADWQKVSGVPVGGMLGDVLAKLSTADGDVGWQSIWRTAMFTASGQFTIPAKTIAVTMCGGGGGGTGIWCMGGGGAQSFWRAVLTGLTVGEIVNLTKHQILTVSLGGQRLQLATVAAVTR